MAEKLHGILTVGGIPTREYPFYSGNYAVTPSFEKQVLSSKNKILLNDVQVAAIAVTRTTNSADGITVTIGG